MVDPSSGWLPLFHRNQGIILIVIKMVMLHKAIAACTKLKGVTTSVLLAIGSAIPILVL